MPKREDAPDRMSGEHCIIVSIPLEEKMGTKVEREWCFALEDRIEDALKISATGFVDGDEWGEFEWKLFIYGRRAAKIWDSIKPVLLMARCPKGSFATRRHGEATTAKEVSVPLFGPNAGEEPEPIVLKSARKPGAPDDPQPGDVYAVPLESGGVGILVVSRSAEARHAFSFAFCYLLDTRFDHQPEPREFKNSKPTDTCLVGFVLKSILRSKRCAWLGRLPDFSLEEWPMPPSLEKYEISFKGIVSHGLHTFDESTLPRVVRSTPAKTTDIETFPEVKDFEYLSALSGQWHRSLRGVLKSHRSGSVPRLHVTSDILRDWWRHERSHTKPANPNLNAFARSSKAAVPRAGDAWAEPLTGGGFALVLLAQLDSEYKYGFKHGLAYAFRRRFDEVPSLEDASGLTINETALVHFIYVGKRHPIRATYLGQLPGFSPDQWPYPPAMHRDSTMLSGFYENSLHEQPYLHINGPNMQKDETLMRKPTKRELERWRELNPSFGTLLGDSVGQFIDRVVRHEDPLYGISIGPDTLDFWRSLWKELKPGKSRKK